MPWHGATLEWVARFNNRRLPEPIGYIRLQQLRQTIAGNSPVTPASHATTLAV